MTTEPDTDTRPPGHPFTVQDGCNLCVCGAVRSDPVHTEPDPPSTHVAIITGRRLGPGARLPPTSPSCSDGSAPTHANPTNPTHTTRTCRLRRRRRGPSPMTGPP